MGLGIDVLMAGGAVKVTASMTRNVFESHFQFTTTHASASIETDTALMDLGDFSFVGFASMGFETRVSEKVPTAIVTSLRGFQTARVGVKEIGTLFLETATTSDLELATMLPLIVVRFETVAAHMTAVEETRKRGDHVIMSFLVEQDELFAWGGRSKTRDVVRTACIHQEYLVLNDGSGFAGSGSTLRTRKDPSARGLRDAVEKRVLVVTFFRL